MAGYRRFIAYVYEYRKGKKGSNCGFIKVEVRERRCRLEVHLQCPGLSAQMGCRIYGFVRNGGLMDGYLLDTCSTDEGVVECLIETDALNMSDTGVGIGKMGGLILKTESGAFFGTEWDDIPIRPENFREVKPDLLKEKKEVREEKKKPEEMKQKKEEKLTEIEPNMRNESDPGLETNVQQKGERSVAEKMNVQQEEKRCAAEEMNVQQQIKREVGSPINARQMQNVVSAEINAQQMEKSVDAEINMQQKERTIAGTEMNIRQNGKNTINPGESIQQDEKGTASAESAEPEIKSQQMEKLPESQMPNAVQTSEMNMADQQSDRRKNSKENPHPEEDGRPFEDGEFMECRRIQLKDLSHLNRRDAAMRNNRFLQYGYYNFGHLLICRRQDGRYILGVPGGYDQQERFMANMFGFPYFKESRHIQLPKGRGGYWYRLINTPDFH